jgi:hypothetical protein
MNEQEYLPRDRVGIFKIDSLTVFSHAWAAQTLVQLVFYRHWFSEGILAGYICAALAISVFMFPGRIWLFAAMLASSIIYFVSQWPFVVNHVFIDTFLSATMLAALVLTALIFKRSNSHFERYMADEWFQKFAPVCGAIFAFIYFSIIISKLNYGFFDLDISCLSGMIEEAHSKRPILSPLLSLASVEFFFWFFMIAEALLPLMLAVRRTRLAAFYFGVPFHLLLGLMGHWPFSSFMLSLYMLVAMPALLEVVRSIAGYLDGLREKFAPWAHAQIAFAAGSGLLLMSALLLKPSWVWLLWTLAASSIIIVAVLQENLRQGMFSGTGVTPIWTAKPGWLWVVFALVVLNSASPYIGLKTESNVAMYSNMRTEGGVNNHLFLPTVQLFHFQDDLVEVVDSNNEEILKLKSHPARYGYIGQQFDTYVNYFEFRRVVSGLKDPNLEITYRYNGEALTFKRGSEDNVDADLDVPPPMLLAKILHFRPVFKRGLSYCLH